MEKLTIQYKSTLSGNQILDIENGIEVIIAVEGHDRYYVSSFGYVISQRRVKPVILKGESILGYIRVSMCNGKREFLHRIIALNFLENPENKPQVNHKDGVKTNNILSNLEWATVSENAIHAFSIGLRKDHTGMKRSIQARENISKACMGRIPWNKKSRETVNFNGIPEGQFIDKSTLK